MASKKHRTSTYQLPQAPAVTVSDAFLSIGSPSTPLDSRFASRAHYSSPSLYSTPQVNVRYDTSNAPTREYSPVPPELTVPSSGLAQLHDVEQLSHTQPGLPKLTALQTAPCAPDLVPPSPSYSMAEGLKHEQDGQIILARSVSATALRRSWR